MSGSCFILTCYETVHRTVSAKFINEFGASCLLCFAQFTPPNKKQKAPKRAWTQCPSSFFNPSECNKLHPPSHLSIRSVLLHFVQRSPPETRTLYKGGKKVNLISGPSKSVSFLGRGEMNGVFIINFVKFIQTRNFFRRGAL